MVSRRTADLGQGGDGVQAHQPQPSSHAFRLDLVPLLFEPSRHPSHTINGRPRLLLSHAAHECQILWAFPGWLVVEARPAQPKHLTLPSHTEERMLRFHELALDLKPSVQLFFEPVSLAFELTDRLGPLGFERFFALCLPHAPARAGVR